MVLNRWQGAERNIKVLGRSWWRVVLNRWQDAERNIKVLGSKELEESGSELMAGCRKRMQLQCLGVRSWWRVVLRRQEWRGLLQEA